MDIERIKVQIFNLEKDIQQGFDRSFNTELLLELAKDYVERKEEYAKIRKAIENSPIVFQKSSNQLEQERGSVKDEVAEAIPFALVTSAKNYCKGRNLPTTEQAAILEFAREQDKAVRTAGKVLCTIKQKEF